MNNINEFSIEFMYSRLVHRCCKIALRDFVIYERVGQDKNLNRFDSRIRARIWLDQLADRKWDPKLVHKNN